MTNLNIQQGQNIEIVSTETIKKLYETALSVPTPSEGEQDDAYMSGNLQVDKTYRTYVSYLTTRFPDLHINVTGDYYIPFEDPNVESVLMANNISSDGIGITEGDAATANLGTIFKNNTSITSFNEFKYFTRANTNPSASMFEGCTNLSSIDLSEATSFSSKCFYGCSSLQLTQQDIQNATTIGGGAFCDTLLSGPIDLSNLTQTKLDDQVFYRTKITSVVLPTTLTRIDWAVFWGCLDLETINLSHVTSLWQGQFEGCTKLGEGETLDINLSAPADTRIRSLFGKTKYKKLIMSSSVNMTHTYNYPPWENMSKLEYLDTSGLKLSNAMWGSTYGTPLLNTLILSPGFTSWEWRGMNGLSNLQYCIILNPTPPTISGPGNYFTGNNAGNAIIYVVDDTAKAAYLADSNWSQIDGIQTRLKTLAELPAGVWTTGLSSQYLSNSNA